MLPHMALAMNLSILFEVIWRIGGKELGSIILTYSPYSDVTCGVLQGSILGPVLFNIDICVIFHLNSSFDIASLADDNTPYISDPTEDLGKTEFEISCTKLLKWFRESRKSNSYVISWLHHVIPSELTLKVISIIVQKKNCL